jgi:cytochrome c oxidase assembly protein subunit 15
VTGLARYCRFLLGYNLAVILWGAYVRASGSGAGCGSHWPLCNGEVVPLRPSSATWIEYSHRVSSGLVLVLVAGLAVWAFRVSPKGHPLRRGAILSLAFTLSEAALGAALVLFKLVARDESLARALAITSHLLNTLLLLAALTLSAFAAGAFRAAPAPAPGGREAPRPGMAPPAARAPLVDPRRRWRESHPWLGWAFALGFAATMAIGATGAVAALGDTLFPAASLRQGLAQDLSPASHLLLRLRTLHPLFAIALGAYLLHLCQQAAPAGGEARRWATRLRLLVLAQWTLGVLNLALLAPVWLQLTHLLVADLIWIALVLLALETLAGEPAPAPLAPLVTAAART